MPKRPRPTRQSWKKKDKLKARSNVTRHVVACEIDPNGNVIPIR